MFKIDNNSKPVYDAKHCSFNKSKSTMDVLNIVDPEHAKIYVLKSKKRMELRIKGSFFDDPQWYIPVYEFTKSVDH